MKTSSSLDDPPRSLKGTPITRRRLWIASIPSGAIAIAWILGFILRGPHGSSTSQHLAIVILGLVSGAGAFVISMVLCILLLCRDGGDRQE